MDNIKLKYIYIYDKYNLLYYINKLLYLKIK